MSFAEQMKSLAIISEEENREKKLKRQEEIKDKMFKQLSDKYLLSIKNGILNAAKKGKTEKYINFKREDFKANYHGLGGVVAFQNLWLNEITNPESKYLIDDPDNEGEKINISGIKFKIWNNSSFTTVFSW
tara:strand:+ start:1622 stop:2014 length:393 start_codon:yes stop_codon:yes gene_type:complete